MDRSRKMKKDIDIRLKWIDVSTNKQFISNFDYQHGQNAECKKEEISNLLSRRQKNGQMKIQIQMEMNTQIWIESDKARGHGLFLNLVDEVIYRLWAYCWKM